MATFSSTDVTGEYPALYLGNSRLHIAFSLQATWIRNTILRAIRDSTKTNTRNVSSGFIYEYPTISKLASFVLTLASGTVNGTTVDPATIVQGMRAMVAKYSKDFPVHKGGVKSTGKVVLLTGTTGGLGCYGLQALVADPTVSRVYAFNRPARSGESLRERQRATLVDRGLDPSFLESKKLVLLEGDLSAPAFGLSRDVYQEVSGEDIFAYRAILISWAARPIRYAYYP